MVKIGVFIDAIQIAVAQGAVKADVAAAAIKLYAESGEFFLRRNPFDSAIASDSTLLAFEKRYQEYLTAVDIAALSLSRTVAPDVATASDQVSKGSHKARTDATHASDAQVLAFGKAINDLLALSETMQRVMTKPRADTATVSDIAAKGPSKPRADSAAVSDVASKGPGKSAQDAVGTTDVRSLTATKALADTVTSTDDINGSAVTDDDQVIQFIKTLTDPISAADVLQRIVSYSRAFNESVSVADAASRQASKPVADAVGTSDSGTVFWQSYCDPSYFAGDYVGNSISF